MGHPAGHLHVINNIITVLPRSIGHASCNPELDISGDGVTHCSTPKGVPTATQPHGATRSGFELQKEASRQSLVVLERDKKGYYYVSERVVKTEVEPLFTSVEMYPRRVNSDTRLSMSRKLAHLLKMVAVGRSQAETTIEGKVRATIHMFSPENWYSGQDATSFNSPCTGISTPTLHRMRPHGHWSGTREQMRYIFQLKGGLHEAEGIWGIRYGSPGRHPWTLKKAVNWSSSGHPDRIFQPDDMLLRLWGNSSSSGSQK
ncbi:hypothetical protein F5J12DRAFT_939931 [Pisolithus orientalis]|uniref:uncharacterized protein n=1 Tax=Pisolithus orientalis TaxID=936130 RepID=UPI00222552A8|nr:uncharacterized protein F5J12DRAFT_939931 [Pisolithus orientalis]KAI6006214.1 hypothetical protein F5J12DRAFT_939931 [Pisolithus orientalis]